MISRIIITFAVLPIVIVTFTLSLISCGKHERLPEQNTADSIARKQLQGSWEDEYVGNVVFTILGDTIFYSDSLSAPALFSVKGDTLYVGSDGEIAYYVKRLTDSALVLASSNGEELSLVKSEETVRPVQHAASRITVNQGKKIKRDTVMVASGKRYHVYSQVNPTTYKVYLQNTNPDGMEVETIYYDNFVYIGVYGEKGKIFGQDIRKQDFAALVPENFLSQAILSEILFGRATSEGVSFTAVLAIPDSETSYRINILISPEGKKSLTLK